MKEIRRVTRKLSKKEQFFIKSAFYSKEIRSTKVRCCNGKLTSWTCQKKFLGNKQHIVLVKKSHFAKPPKPETAKLLKQTWNRKTPGHPNTTFPGSPGIRSAFFGLTDFWTPRISVFVEKTHFYAILDFLLIFLDRVDFKNDQKHLFYTWNWSTSSVSDGAETFNRGKNSSKSVFETCSNKYLFFFRLILSWGIRIYAQNSLYTPVLRKARIFFHFSI